MKIEELHEGDHIEYTCRGSIYDAIISHIMCEHYIIMHGVKKTDYGWEPAFQTRLKDVIRIISGSVNVNVDNLQDNIIAEPTRVKMEELHPEDYIEYTKEDKKHTGYVTHLQCEHRIFIRWSKEYPFHDCWGDTIHLKDIIRIITKYEPRQ